MDQPIIVNVPKPKRKQRKVKSRNPNRMFKFKHVFPLRVQKRKDANVSKSSKGKFLSVAALEKHRLSVESSR